MDTQIVVVFCLRDDMLKALHHVEDRQCQMTDAEVLTTASVARIYYTFPSIFLVDFKAIPNFIGMNVFG